MEKVTLNIGVGQAGAKLDKAVRLLQTLSGRKPIQTITQCRIPTWSIRPGLPIGCKVTIRGEKAKELLTQLLGAVNQTLRPSQICNDTVSFGIKEYIEIPGARYDPEVGIIGLQVNVTLMRPGFRIKKRKLKTKKLPKKQEITSEESLEYMKKNFGIKIGE